MGVVGPDPAKPAWVLVARPNVLEFRRIKKFFNIKEDLCTGKLNLKIQQIFKESFADIGSAASNQ
jgi:hypothetical protein